MPKPIFGIDSEKEPLTLDGFEIERPGFERREEEVERIPMDFAPYSNNNVVAMMKMMNYLPRMNLGKTMKKPNIQDPIIPTATPPFGLGYKPIDDDLLEMEVRKITRAKAKAKGLPCPPKPLKPYTPTLNRKFVKAGDSQCYWGFHEPRFDPKTRTMMPGFELQFDCNNNQRPKLEKEDTNWVPTDWADYMNPDAMTMLLGDAICYIEEEKYWETCQHALKSLYEARTMMRTRKGEKPLVIIMKVAMARVIVVVIAVVVTMETVKMIAIVTVKATTVKTMIANIVAMTRVNSLVIEKMKIKGYTMKTMIIM